MLHGIAAYRKESGIYALINRVRAVLDGAEVCCANIALGNIGVSIEGTVTGAFERDCWSEIDKNGNRVESGYRNVFCRTNREGLTHDDIKTVMMFHKCVNSAYAEFWAKDCILNAVWVKISASDRVKKMANVIARYFGLASAKIVPDHYDVSDNILSDESDDDATPSELEMLEERLLGY